MRIERRLRQPWWLTVVVPVFSILLAFVLSAIVLLLTGHPPLKSFHRLFDAAFIANGALTETVVSATPLVFTGLAAAVAFRMNLFNIGGEGQLYGGAITGATVGLLLAGTPSPLVIAGMILAGAAGGAFLAAIPAVLRAFFSTNEIITSLMLNYVVGLVLEYLIFDSHSYLRDTTGFEAKVFPQGKTLPDEATWSSWTIHGLVLPLGFVLAVVLAVLVWILYSRTRFGFEVQVIGDSPLAACFGRPLRHAFALRRARRATRGAVGRPQPGRRGDDADGCGHGLLGGRARRRPQGARASGSSRRRGARWGRDGGDSCLSGDHVACESNRVGARADDLRRRSGPVVLSRQRPAPVR